MSSDPLSISHGSPVVCGLQFRKTWIGVPCWTVTVDRLWHRDDVNSVVLLGQDVLNHKRHSVISIVCSAFRALQLGLL